MLNRGCSSGVLFFVPFKETDSWLGARDSWHAGRRLACTFQLPPTMGRRGMFDFVKVYSCEFGMARQPERHSAASSGIRGARCRTGRGPSSDCRGAQSSHATGPLGQDARWRLGVFSGNPSKEPAGGDSVTRQRSPKKSVTFQRLSARARARASRARCSRQSALARAEIFLYSLAILRATIVNVI